MESSLDLFAETFHLYLYISRFYLLTAVVATFMIFLLPDIELCSVGWLYSDSSHKEAFKVRSSKVLLILSFRIGLFYNDFGLVIEIRVGHDWYKVDYDIATDLYIRIESLQIAIDSLLDLFFLVFSDHLS